jgi:outer membrane protein OmpA-like peptidoglycan-associated protein
MKRMRVLSAGLLVLVFLFSFLFSCATTDSVTKHDKTAKGAGIGAAAGAVGALVTGKREADEILAGAAIGAAIGGGVGAYMDHQEAKLAKIPGTHVERLDESTLLVHFDSDVLFAVDSATLSGDARGALGQAASVMNEYDKTAVVVQGHTDSTGSEQHNQGLSERRAGSVVTELVSRGVNNDRIASMGFGESQPVADNATSEGRRRNRRVDVMLRAKAK